MHKRVRWERENNYNTHIVAEKKGYAGLGMWHSVLGAIKDGKGKESGKGGQLFSVVKRV